MGFGLPTLICGLLWDDWWGGFLIGGVAGAVFIMHCTFCINSLAHWCGDYPFADHRTAVDNWWISLVTFGEGYHNFHHEFPFDYRNGVSSWAYDPAKWLCYILEKLNIVWDVKRMDPVIIQKGRLQMMQKKISQAQLQLNKKIEEVSDWPADDFDLPEVTVEELEKKRGDEADFVIVNGYVHDVHNFLDLHPGGRAFLQPYLGKDATRAFDGSVYRHSHAARNILGTLRSARVKDWQAPEAHISDLNVVSDLENVHPTKNILSILPPKSLSTKFAKVK